jgi:ankyrin repeat domain-containing protein 50
VIYDLAGNEKLHWTDTQDPVFKTSMTKLCSYILEFLARAACHLEKHPITRTLKDMFNQGEWDTLLSAIKGAEARVYNHSAVNGWKDVRMIREAQEKDQLVQQTATLSKETAARNEKITAFLQKLNEHAWPGGDSYEYSKERVQRAEEGTCKWFTNHDKFKAWESPDNPNSGSLLLLTAYPGCGKSVLSKHLIDTVLPKLKDRAVCYFFFKDDFKHQKSATGALCTLLHQLLIISEWKRHTSLADSALRRLETMGEGSFFGSVSSLWKTFTEAALHTDAGEVICILDALDECQLNDRNELIKAINEFYRTLRNQASCPLKLFLTTRPYGDIIQSQFSYAWGHKLPEIRLAGEEDDVANDIVEEIKIVVDKRIDQICDTFHLTKRKSNLMKTNLGAAPGRTYLWITLVFDDLLKKTSGISKEYIESFVKNPPKDVNDAYEKILNRSKTQGLGNQDLKKTQNILQMIIAARRPLTLGEMSIALLLLEYQPLYQDLADEMESKEGTWDIIRDCCGLLVIRVDDRLYLLHQTVREFLVATGPDINSENQKAQDTPDSRAITPHSYLWKYSIDLTDANSVLAEACISYLYSNFSKMDDSLLDYSAIYWIDHYRQSGQNCQVAVANMTRDICLPSEPRAKWTKIHNRHNRIPATGSLLCLASALGLDSAVEEFLHEQNLTGIDLEAEVDSNDDLYRRTPLSWAAEGGHEAVVKLLLASKAEVDSKDSVGQTPLSWAAERGHEAVVKLLLVSKAEVDLKDYSSQTPLSWAAGRGHEAVVKLLLVSKAEVDSKDYGGQTPLSWAAESGHEAVVKLLLASKAEVDSEGYDGRTPLSWAAERGHEAVVKLLLVSKAEVDLKDNSYSRTPLSWAAERGHEAVVKLLLAGKAKVDSKDCYGWTPLSWAVENGHEAVVKLLSSNS